MASACKGRKMMVPSPISPITILMRVPFLTPSFRPPGDGKTTCPRELTVVVYTSDSPAVFLLIASSYSYVRRFSPSFLSPFVTKTLPPHVQPLLLAPAP